VSEPVCIELSSAQVDGIVRAASDGGSLSLLLSGLDGVRELLRRTTRTDNRRLSYSLLSGLSLLACFPADGSPLRVTDAAAMLDMSASTTHRYLQTLMAVGLVERDPGTRQYRLVAAFA